MPTALTLQSTPTPPGDDGTLMLLGRKGPLQSPAALEYLGSLVPSEVWTRMVTDAAPGDNGATGGTFEAPTDIRARRPNYAFCASDYHAHYVVSRHGCGAGKPW